MMVDIFTILPENTGECFCGQVMDEHQVSQAGQRLFRIPHLLLQKAWDLFSLQQRLVHKTGDGLSDSTEGGLYNRNRPSINIISNQMSFSKFQGCILW